MKKPKKLGLSRETIRVLTPAALAAVNGGAGQANCPTSRMAYTTEGSCSNYETHSQFCTDRTVTVPYTL